MEDSSGERKINRRRTRTKTQVIQFDMSELDNLRTSQAGNIVEPGLQQISVDNFLNNNYTLKQNEEVHGLRGRQTQLVVEDIPTPINPNVHVRTNNPNRMFSFSDISNYFKKIEKRDLHPKNKHDYIYKKSKLGTVNQNNNDIMEEKNIIHMRIEEELIPCLNTNPFIQADKKCKNK